MILLQNTPLQTEKTLSLIELIKDCGLGGQLIIGLLFLLLIIVIYIYFERLFTIKSASKISPNFMSQIKTYVLNHKIDGAQALCLTENKPVARLISKGLSRIGRPLDDISTTIENAGRLEIYKLEKNVSILATIAGAAPMIGFLGTVFGASLGAFLSINIEYVRKFLSFVLNQELFSPEIYFLNNLPSKISFSEVFFIIFTSMSLSILASVFPSWKASKILPAEVLRYE